ncbi:hypothetical protein [Pseudonocardia sp. Ae717_Ps2]|uniref:hypothetical protein n=2 Tax=Pseudonocardia sp. Ae717_Ps2 TaxID=1885573 RepID=UPI00094AAB01|nr:hypothetical protein [Pseudonocardia sp. Ae717_Ps2]
MVVLEEFAGLLRLASTAPVEKGQPKMREQLLALYGRLVSEGHKAGLRLMVVTSARTRPSSVVSSAVSSACGSASGSTTRRPW